MKTIISIFVLLLVPALAQAKLQVLTSTTDLAAIAREVGGSDINVDAIAKGTQDPHFIEAKPSYMVKAAHADLIISVGLGLEVGWLPSIIRGARNTKITEGKGNLEVGPFCDPIEVPKGGISRAEGDVHPEGNPHVTLDPQRVGTIALKIADRLSELDSSHTAGFHERAKKIQDRMKEKTISWKARIKKTGIKNVITHHKTLNYFLNAFEIENPIELEPKPGIPPTSKHIIEVIHVVREKKVPLIMIENFFDEKVADRVKEDVPTLRIVSVPVAVEGAAGIQTMDDLFEKLVSTVEGK
jgi:zinc/manganese transport system substrate-binding protein